ncbi:hypothetical protein [Rugosimonospora africana]|uniref:hypothetical protein n=1 Tax=Rugosimonospora africana TaxID=556532 RepID=UPI001943D64F|nr:hypothetical protein [Rugosimonospora africana]
MVAFLVLLVMALIAAGSFVESVQSREWLGMIVFGPMTLWLGVGAARAMFLGVFARRNGIVMRGLWRTTVIPWDEVTQITDGQMTGSASGAGTTVVVQRRRPNGAEPERVELNALGGYGLSRVRPTPAERAITDLNQHLATWHNQGAA